MTLYSRAMVAALISAWLAIAGLVLLGGWHLAVVALAFIVADNRPSCGHDVDCSSTWGGR